jgi:hypothetical protein
MTDKKGIVLLDTGTTYSKIAAFDGESTTKIISVPAKIKEIDENALKRLVAKFSTCELKVGLYTEAEIGEHGPFANDKWFQFNALAEDSPILLVGLKNALQFLEEEAGLDILNHPEEWVIAFAVAAKEEKTARDKLRNVYSWAAKQLGFAGVYIDDQLSFDIYGSIPDWKKIKKELDSKMQSTLIIADAGGGDTKVVAVSGGQPIPESLVTVPLGGQRIIDKGINIIRELSSSPVTDFTPITDWINELGSVSGGIPDIWSDNDPVFKNYNDREYNITDIVRLPEMFFDPVKYGLKTELTPSLTEVISRCVEKVKMSITTTDILSELLGCVILVGGSALFHDMDKRLESELQEKYPLYNINVRVANNAQSVCMNGMVAFFRKLVQKSIHVEDTKNYIPLDDINND